MHEHHLVQHLLTEALQQVPSGKRATRITVSLSPDAHMDETSVRLHVENLATDTALDGAEIVIQPAPARLFCAACNKLVERPAGAFNCPACGQPARPAPFASGLTLVGVIVI